MLNGYTNDPLTAEDAKTLQSLPLEEKAVLTFEKICQWDFATNGAWYVSISGGKDSTVLAYIAAKLLTSYRTPSHPLHLLFCDTGLEYPEVRRFAMALPEFLQQRFPTVTVDFRRVRPKTSFFDVMCKYGYPLISKEVSKRLREFRRGGVQARQELTGKREGGMDYDTALYDKRRWFFLTQAPFLASHICCNKTKKQPAHKFDRESGLYPVVATMAEESLLRRNIWLRTGCNAFDGKRPTSKPMSFWTTQDVLRYILQEGIPLASVYGDVAAFDGENYYSQSFGDVPLKCTGCQRTGCVFCCFGAHLEKGDDRRFVRLKETHPKHYRYAMEGGDYDIDGFWTPSKNAGHIGLGLRRVLHYIGDHTGVDFGV